MTTTLLQLYCRKISNRKAPTLSRGPRVRPSVVKMVLSPKSGSVPTHDTMGTFQKLANSATGFRAEKEFLFVVNSIPTNLKLNKDCAQRQTGKERCEEI